MGSVCSPGDECVAGFQLGGTLTPGIRGQGGGGGCGHTRTEVGNVCVQGTVESAYCHNSRCCQGVLQSKLTNRQ